MIQPIVDIEKIDQLKRDLTRFHQFVIVCHTSPDGDAMGSSMALYHLITELGGQATVVLPDALPSSLGFLQLEGAVINYKLSPQEGDATISQAEAIVCLDFNALSRMGDLLSPVIASSSAYKIMIDHHLYPEPFVQLQISYPKMTSTCQLLMQCICQMEMLDLVTSPCAEALYTGMMTDTGNFTYNSNSPELFIMIALLLQRGVDKDAIYARIFHDNTLDKIQLNGYATSNKLKIYADHQAAMIALTREEINQYHYRKGDTEGLVNVPLTIRGVCYSVFFREESDYIKVSLRSKGSFPVNLLAENHFNGGGHRNAAGGEFQGTMQQAIDLFESILPQYSQYLVD